MVTLLRRCAFFLSRGVQTGMSVAAKRADKRSKHTPSSAQLSACGSNKLDD
jgi:hypothetical protein